MDAEKLRRSIENKESFGASLRILLHGCVEKQASAEKKARLRRLNRTSWRYGYGCLWAGPQNYDRTSREEMHIRYCGWRQIYVSLTTFEPEDDVSDWPADNLEDLHRFCNFLREF